MDLMTLLLVVFAVLSIVGNAKKKQEKEAKERARMRNVMAGNQPPPGNSPAKAKTGAAAQASYADNEGEDLPEERAFRGPEAVQTQTPVSPKRPTTYGRPAPAANVVETKGEGYSDSGSMKGYASTEGTSPSGSMKGFVSTEGMCPPTHRHESPPTHRMNLEGQSNLPPTPSVSESKQEGNTQPVGKNAAPVSAAPLAFSGNPVINGLVWGEILKRPCDRRRRI